MALHIFQPLFISKSLPVLGSGVQNTAFFQIKSMEWGGGEIVHPRWLLLPDIAYYLRQIGYQRIPHDNVVFQKFRGVGDENRNTCYDGPGWTVR